MLVVKEKDGYIQGYNPSSFWIENGELIIERDYTDRQIIYVLKEKVSEVIIDGTTIWQSEV